MREDPVIIDRPALRNRLRTVAGHLRGVERMVARDAYCIDLMKQVQAIQHALDRVAHLLLAGYLHDHVTETLAGEDLPTREAAVTTLLTLYRGAAGAADVPAAADVSDRTAWLAHVGEQVAALEAALLAGASPVTLIATIQQIQAMLAAFNSRVLVDHLNGCVTTAIRSEQPSERTRVVDELLQVFALRQQLG